MAICARCGKTFDMDSTKAVLTDCEEHEDN